MTSPGPQPPFVSGEVEERAEAEHDASRLRSKRTEIWNKARHLLLPWSGMLGAGIGWALTDQVGSDLVQSNCRHAYPPLMILIGLIGLTIAGLGGLTSWRVHEREEGGRRFISFIGTFMAALFMIAIFLQTSASLFLPRCFG